MRELLAFATCVSKEYQSFIPWYVLGINRVYPHSKIILSLDCSVDSRVEKALVEINAKNVAIISNAFPRVPGNKNYVKTQRWVHRPELYDDFKYIYVGDIDIIICKEDPAEITSTHPLVSMHVEHMVKRGLYYHNVLKHPENRLGGLHFYDSENWYKTVGPVIEKNKEAILEKAIANPKMSCEYSLYDMVVQAGIGLPERSSSWREELYFHGLHLGRFRSIRDEDYKDDYNKYCDQIPEIVLKGYHIINNDLQPANTYFCQMVDYYCNGNKY